MSRFFSEKFKSLDPYVPGEQPRDMKYVKLNTNESPYPPSPEVLASMSPENAGKLRLYPDPESAAYDIRMRTAIVDHYLKLTVGDINLSGISFPDRISSMKEGRRIVSSYVSSRCNDVKDKQTVKLSDLLSSVISDIEANYADGLYSLSKASENLGISSTYLSKILLMQ